jgi:hypothetical protein
MNGPTGHGKQIVWSNYGQAKCSRGENQRNPGLA